MDKLIKLMLPDTDVGQIIDGLSVRRDSWRITQKYLEGEEVDCVIEECSDPYESQAIADYYTYLIDTIRKQRDSQHSQQSFYK